MPALRCSMCNINWPIGRKYKNCPECLEPTSVASNLDPISDEEARSLKAHADFERYYEETRSEDA